MSSLPIPDEPSFEELAGAVDEAAKAAAELDGIARKVVDEVRRSVEAAHRDALVTIVRTLRADEAGKRLLFELVDDPMVHLLFSLHGIIRPDPMTAGQAALDQVRPGIQSHGGDVELVRITDGTAFVRLSGACNGCSMSSVTMRTTVEEALVAGVPSVSAVEVLPSEPAPTVIQLSPMRRKEDPPTAEAGWARAAEVADLAQDTITSLQLKNAAGRAVDVIVVRLGEQMNAYVNECAHQGMPLDDAELDLKTGELTCIWHGFCYEADSGECTSSPGAALEALPLRVEDGAAWIRVG